MEDEKEEADGVSEVVVGKWCWGRTGRTAKVSEKGTGLRTVMLQLEVLFVSETIVQCTCIRIEATLSSGAGSCVSRTKRVSGKAIWALRTVVRQPAVLLV